MHRSSPSSDDSSARDTESAGSDAGNAPYTAVSTTRRRYLALAGVSLSATTAGCASTGSDSSPTGSGIPEPADEPSTDPEIAERGTASNDDRESDDDTEPDDDDDPESIDDLPLFDAHTHIVPTEARGRDPLSTDELVDWMDATGIDRAVVLPFEYPESYPVQAPTSLVLEEVAAYPDRLVPFCAVDPRDVDGADAAALLERYIDRGARGFGELKIELAVDDARLEPLYELCATYELPILFHTDQQSMRDEVGLPRLESVLASYPEVDFIAHAHGWWSHMAADVAPRDLGTIPEGPIEAPGRIWELLAAYDNIYGDLSTLGGWNALTRDHEYGQALLETHHDQLVFGSDYLFPGQQVPLVALFERFELELDAWANLRSRNLEGLFR